MQQTLILNEALARGLDLIGDKWTLSILREAFYGHTRFEEFRQNTGISRATLTRRLATLTDAGVFRKQQAQSGLRKEYQLSKKGAALLDASLLALQWEAQWNESNFKAKKVVDSIVHESCGQKLEPKVVCAHCEEPIHYSEISWLDSDLNFDDQVSSIKASHAKTRRRSASNALPENANLIDLIADRWSILILVACFFDVTRFDTFISKLNIPSSILSERLKLMLEQDILLKMQPKQSSKRFEYGMTEKGRSLFPFVMMLRQWVNEVMLEQEPNQRLIHTGCGQPLRLKLVCSACGEKPEAAEISF